MEVEAAVMDTAERMGFISLYDEQKEAVLSFVGHKDILVLLLTGRGKSLCYLLVPWTFDCLHKRSGKQVSIVVVVSPLVER